MSTTMPNRAPLVDNGLNRLDSRLDALFGQIFGEGAQTRGSAARPDAISPPLSIWSDEGHLHIEVDLPGVVLEDLDVSIHEKVLTIRAQRRIEEERRYAYNGRAFGRFERVLTLPDSLDAESVDARLANGVLSLTLRKRPEAQVRKIDVRQD
ncbi:Hsp20/alpha crystallin family protein [Planctomyces sp. SH-PL62]|uniref:Hsp20/alpha crystallin family protein n=1 Tax=Planctomyces sp. SH-PL62 TaxID=1636152 RepID=UPI00078D433A|nr:Hsp20/alpha crystallin family protein [Planctomyces sp. SH-PL62]AMV36619.1 Spore protein SP21 [Planctomyces sp. SH-PL62]